jgi:ubiquinone/menaquinone biosynthesis C-methylase UbiE
LSAPGARTLEIGCGEGRVTRDLVARGHRVVALDTSVSLVRHAADADPHGRYALADGAALPFRDGCFETVVAYNVLQVVADMAHTVSEAGRVTKTGGSLCACVAHPVTDLGRFVDDEDTLAVRQGYFENRRVEEAVHSDGHTMTFRGWTYPLEHYSTALEAAGFRIELLREPVPGPSAEEYRRWRAVPLFLMFRAVKT